MPQEDKGMVAGLQCTTPLKAALLLHKVGLVKTKVPTTVVLRITLEKMEKLSFQKIIPIFFGDFFLESSKLPS